MLELIAAAAALATASPPSYEFRPLYRPLRIPTIAPGAPCPASSSRSTLRHGITFPAFGPGPAFPTLEKRSGRAAVGMVWEPTNETRPGWAGTKVLWAVPRYDGAVLIRGRQLDGPNRVGFDLGPSWTRTVLRELRLVGPTYDLRPAATFVQAPGCYAYQVDTLRSSYRIVFEAY